MKKLFLVVMVALAFVVSFSTITKAEEVIVSGYQAGDYAVKGAVKKSLDGIISQLAGEQVVITIAGSADTVGRSTINDELAAKRAEHARAYLAGKLPLAEVKAPWSEGDAANARQVKVTYIFKPKPIVAKVKAVNNSIAVIFVSFIFLAFVLASVYALIKSAKQRPAKDLKKKEMALARLARLEKPTANKKVTIELEESGLYETDIEFDSTTGRWLTPFRHLDGNERMWAKSEGDARRSAQKCWRQTERYGCQIEELMANKTIREINKQAVA